MDIQDKILSAVLDIQGDVKDLKERMGKMEDVQGRVCDKLDSFMILINRHEAEIAERAGVDHAFEVGALDAFYLARFRSVHEVEQPWKAVA